MLKSLEAVATGLMSLHILKSALEQEPASADIPPTRHGGNSARRSSRFGMPVGSWRAKPMRIER